MRIATGIALARGVQNPSGWPNPLEGSDRLMARRNGPRSAVFTELLDEAALAGSACRTIQPPSPPAAPAMLMHRLFWGREPISEGVLIDHEWLVTRIFYEHPRIMAGLQEYWHDGKACNNLQPCAVREDWMERLVLLCISESDSLYCAESPDKSTWTTEGHLTRLAMTWMKVVDEHAFLQEYFSLTTERSRSQLCDFIIAFASHWVKTRQACEAYAEERAEFREGA